MSPDRPNVVVLVLDSVRRDHVSCYGYGRETTPHVDRIASEAAVFERAFATSCWTLPSHGSLFTGLYPSRHGVELESLDLAGNVPTLASELRKLGYRTMSVSCNGFVTEQTGLSEGFEEAIDADGLAGGDAGIGRVIRAIHRRWRRLTARDRGAGRATRIARRWLRRRDPQEPFFLFMNYMDCHLPYALHSGELYRFVAPDERARADAVSQDPFAFMAGEVELGDDDLRLLKALYDGALHYLDRRVGELYEELRRTGVLDDTVLIVTSDHGESFGEHGLLDHQYGLYEHLLSVPLIIRYPPWTAGGSRESSLVQHVDLVPTVLELAGSKGSARVTSDGVSLVEGPRREAVFAEYPRPNLRPFRRRFPEMDVGRFDVALRSVRRERFKLVERNDGRAMLFDLENDPEETTDTAGEHPEVTQDLRELLVSTLGERKRGRIGSDADIGEKEMRERLELLGYL